MCPQHLGFLGSMGAREGPSCSTQGPLSAADSSAQGDLRSVCRVTASLIVWVGVGCQGDRNASSHLNTASSVASQLRPGSTSKEMLSKEVLPKKKKYLEMFISVEKHCQHRGKRPRTLG